MGSPTSVSSHVIDGSDRIQRVNSTWLRFAAANGAPHLTREAVLGRPLWEFVADEETTALYRYVLQTVRAARVRPRFPFRCDAPSLLRWMEMEVVPLRGDRVAFCCRVLRELERAPISLLDPTRDRSAEILLVCSLCRRLKMGLGWQEVDVALGRLRLFEAAALPRLVHSVCPDCHRRVLGEIGRLGVS
jgi:hypothetical protein